MKNILYVLLFLSILINLLAGSFYLKKEVYDAGVRTGVSNLTNMIVSEVSKTGELKINLPEGQVILKK